MLCCQQSLVRSDARAVSRTQPSAHRHPFTDARTRSPSRATGRDLYPNPIRSDTSRHETGASSGGDSDDTRRRSRSGNCALDDLTTRAPPPRRVGARGPRKRRAARVTLARGPAVHGASRDQGPHLPYLREEARDPPHPRCLPSVKPATGSPDDTLSSTVWSTGGRDEPYLYPGMVLSTACCQPGDNTRRFFQARCIRSP